MHADMITFGKVLNKELPIPLHYQLREILLGEIENGNLTPGDVIPTEKELSSMFQISRTTVRQAITDMVKDGFFYRIKGKGTFVSRPKISLDYMTKIESFNEQIKKSGLTPMTRLLEFTTIDAADEIAGYLNLPINARVIKVVRLRFADYEPIAIVESYHPYDICSFIMEHDLSKVSLYQVLALNPQSKVYKVERTVEAIIASEYESGLLKIKKGFPLQYFLNIAYNKDGRPVEYCISKYRGDRNKFSVVVYA